MNARYVILLGFALLFMWRVEAHAASWTNFQPGDYSSINSCKPISGLASAPLKIIFVNLNNAPQFDQAVRLAIKKQFKTTSPFKEHLKDIAFFKTSLKGNFGCKLVKTAGGKLMQCENWRIRGMVGQNCGVSDPNAPIIIAATPGEYLASALNIITEPLGKPGNRNSLARYMDLFLASIVHEVAHEFALGDLYIDHPGTGLATASWGLSWREVVLNTDEPGCPRWCSSFKPLNSYPKGQNSKCSSFSDRKSCINFNRKGKRNPADETLCVWSNDKIEYFDNNCVPMWGTGNIGIGCESGTGCYLGANHGQYSWRPVKNCSDSKMCNARIKKFDPVSKSVLQQAMNCCFSSADATPECSAFRTEITASLRNMPSNRLGSCGSYIPMAD